ncbi:MAG: bis(5'-nucleosyl)-tetraphosphatase (symmetrical) YqeK [Oscillospiraceae bacterium]|nr:bis(5'-nucleosyl)-tetraphosphatase (symmetrical) YqeK [Oscillospiraceae bacterium]
MYNIEDKKIFLKERLSKKRYIHSVNVSEESVRLARLYGADAERAEFAGLMHDVCKELPAQEQYSLAVESGFSVCREELESRSLLHGIAGAYFIKKQFGVEDIDIINAIRFHTVGRAGMSRLEEIVYLADLISAERDYKDVDKMRKLVYSDIEKAMLESFRFSIESVLKKGGFIPVCTIEGYNFYMRFCKKNH